MSKRWILPFVVVILAPLLLAPFGSYWKLVNGTLYPEAALWRVANRPALLIQGQNHTVAVVGDSMGAETPYIDIPQNGAVWQLQNMFAEDPAYTQVTGSDLGPTTADTQADDWNVTNATFTPGTETVALTPQQNTFGANTWKARAIYCPNSGGGCAGVNDGINISANPTSRYLVSFEIDATAMAAAQPNAAQQQYFGVAPRGGGSVTLSGSTVTNDSLELVIKATGSCSNAEAFMFANGTLTGASGNIIGLRDRKWATYHIVLDPTSWNWAGNDFSQTGEFADNSCRVQLELNMIAGKSESAITVSLRNITLKRLVHGVAVRRYAYASQTIEGWWEDDYPSLKTLLYTGKTYPLDAVVVMVGRNSYDAQSGTYSGGASTLTSFFATLDSAKTQLAADGISWIKSLGMPSKRVPDAGGIFAGTQDAAAEAWRLYQKSERDWLTRNGIPFLDETVWWDWSNEYLNMTATIDGAEMPGAGASIIVPIGISPPDQSGYVFYAQVVSTVATSGSNASNRWCFDILNRSNAACVGGSRAGLICLNAADCSGGTCTGADPTLNTTSTCTDSGGELSLSIPKSIAVVQNRHLESGTVLAVKITRTGTPTAIAATDFLQITAQIAQGYWNSENLHMFDDQHPSSFGYRRVAEGSFQILTGREANKGLR